MEAVYPEIKNDDLFAARAKVSTVKELNLHLSK